MAATVPTSAASTTSQLANTTQNATKTEQRAVYHITLVCDGVTVTPAQIRAALDAQFGTVAGEKDSFARGTYVFNISA